MAVTAVTETSSEPAFTQGGWSGDGRVGPDKPGSALFCCVCRLNSSSRSFAVSNASDGDTTGVFMGMCQQSSALIGWQELCYPLQVNNCTRDTKSPSKGAPISGLTSRANQKMQLFGNESAG